MIALGLLWLLLSAGSWAQQVTWKTLATGEGPEAKVGDTVAISYELKLINGELLEATPENQSYRFEIGSSKVIPGLSTGMIGMRRGETREITVPSAFGYGSKQVGPIPADSTLVFRVELNYFVKEVASDSLADKFGKDGFENRPDARNLDKPAMFEYLIRDFFTKPWRYDNAPVLVWKANGAITLLVLLLWGFSYRKGRAVR
jgi:hypothetical protein